VIERLGRGSTQKNKVPCTESQFNLKRDRSESTISQQKKNTRGELVWYHKDVHRHTKKRNSEGQGLNNEGEESVDRLTCSHIRAERVIPISSNQLTRGAGKSAISETSRTTKGYELARYSLERCSNKR